MDFFQHNQHGEAYCEDVSLFALAKEYGTPAYIYSQATLSRHCQNLKAAFKDYPTTFCFAVKSNSNLSYLKSVFAEGFGADIVSLGELERALLAGAKPNAVVFSGVGKSTVEIERALEANILSFNVESEFELRHIAEVAQRHDKIAKISLRINPNIDAKTNPKIATGLYSTKFGLAEADALVLADLAIKHPHLELVGMACHIGSQITDLSPLAAAASRMAKLCLDLRSTIPTLKYMNLGGGLGIRYRGETPPDLTEYAAVLMEAVKPTGLQLILEPGRVVAGNTGVLLTKVIGVKSTPEKTFVICDAAMNDLMRPTLYGSFHEIVPVISKEPSQEDQRVLCDFVGPICETGDFIGKDREMPLPKAGDLYFVRSCGAYAASMASQYNSRPRAPQIMVKGATHKLVAPREDLSSMWAEELQLL